MNLIQKLRSADQFSWLAILASIIPLWLLSLAVTAEGFPAPPVPGNVAQIMVGLAIVISLVLLIKGWLIYDVLLLTIFPFILVFIFDEIATGYKTPFILLCAAIWSVGIIGAQRSQSLTWRWLILLFVAVLALVLAVNATQNYWQMGDEIGFVKCFPDPDSLLCPPVNGQAAPWWVLFFSR